MSVYNGFATRQQEAHYNKLVENLIFTLQTRLASEVKLEEVDEEKFRRRIMALYENLKRLELQKHSAPKITESCKDLLDLYIPRERPQSKEEAGAIFPMPTRKVRPANPLRRKVRSTSRLGGKKISLSSTVFKTIERSPLPSLIKPSGFYIFVDSV